MEENLTRKQPMNLKTNGIQFLKMFIEMIWPHFRLVPSSWATDVPDQEKKFESLIGKRVQSESEAAAIERATLLGIIRNRYWIFSSPLKKLTFIFFFSLKEAQFSQSSSRCSKEQSSKQATEQTTISLKTSLQRDRGFQSMEDFGYFVPKPTDNKRKWNRGHFREAS